MRLLILRLQGPLQSWGERSKWDNRDSASMPTKSGVIGIIACCMGIGRDDAELVELHRKLKLAVRADMPGRLGTDYHTVSSDRMMNSEGKLQQRTIVSFRQYLQDASFLAVLHSEDDALLDRIVYAMHHPKWTAFLGRKSCVPTYPLLPLDTNEYSSVKDALNRHPLADRAALGSKNDVVRAEIESAQGLFDRNDELRAAGRHFASRKVEYYNVDKEGFECTVRS